MFYYFYIIIVIFILLLPGNLGLSHLFLKDGAVTKSQIKTSY